MVSTESVADYLKRASAPVPLKRLAKDLGVRPADITRVIDEAVQAGAAVAWPRFRNAVRYWHRPPDAVIREEVLAIAGETALPKKDLIRTVAKRAQNCGAKAADTAVSALAREGLLKSAKTVGTTALFFNADRPAALVEASFSALRERLRRYGIDAAGPAVAPEQPTAEADGVGRLLDVIRRLQPAPAVPVTVQSVRAAVPELRKEEFDAAVLALADQQRIYLTTHDHGWALPETERDQLVWDGGQKLYVAVTLRD